MQKDENILSQKNVIPLSQSLQYDSIFYKYISLFPTKFTIGEQTGEIVEAKFEDIKKVLCKQNNCFGISATPDNIVLEFKFKEQNDSLVAVIVGEFTESIDTIKDDWDFGKD